MRVWMLLGMICVAFIGMAVLIMMVFPPIHPAMAITISAVGTIWIALPLIE